jgi:hypothetical protein
MSHGTSCVLRAQARDGTVRVRDLRIVHVRFRTPVDGSCGARLSVTQQMGCRVRVAALAVQHRRRRVRNILRVVTAPNSFSTAESSLAERGNVRATVISP